MMTIADRELAGFITSVLVAAGVPAANASHVAEALTWTNLRGLDSHGVQLLPHYVKQIERGDVSPAAEGRIVSEAGACAVYDSGQGLGQVTSRICCDHVVRLAKQYGVGMIVARECNHFGAAGFWSHRISQAGLIGIVMCDASMQVPPWQGRETRLGTNPISVAVPHPGGQGWLLDMATTTVAYAKLEQAWLKGQTSIPSGWALDSEGVPTTDTERALQSCLLMPLGGYKGSGLAMMVEILSGVLAGGDFFGPRVTGVRDKGRPMHSNHTFIAVDVARFLPLTDFYTRLDWLVREIKSAAPAKGFDEVLVAGDPEWRAMEQRRAEGIPIHDAVWRTVVEVAERLGVTVPSC